MTLQAIAIPVENPQGLLVALHGWGANSQDLVGLAQFLDLPNHTLIFPEAPFQHSYSEVGRMWYGFPSEYSFLSNPAFQQQPDLQQSRQQLREFLLSLEEKTGVPLDRTVLAGFSQGGAMTLDVGSQLPLAALLILSGYMHSPIDSVNSAIGKILIVHGRQDDVVPLRSAIQMRDRLTEIAAPVEYQEFEMGHEIRPIVLQIVQNFMKTTVFSTGDKD
ncbi:dienelactone hydrolase family protein [Microcoleus sp. FACHB-1515]|uniref:alpha/beta hydrolase n=1 Tax=Cyanophyceae TaxID=3028117 RepID=UPI0016821349|nr:dienelactone hydrolase family protein [Microcoleus sp. FACHB-1515]MBD2088976.1 dienelactone hydrolase family protein [Microcoleus sp. FACHB-1515]